MEHISKKTFQMYSRSIRLKRSILQYDQGIKKKIDLEHNTCTILQEPILQSLLPQNTKIVIDLLEPCTKRELAINVKAKQFGLLSRIQKKVLFKPSLVNFQMRH